MIIGTDLLIIDYLIYVSVCYITLFILRIQTPQLFTMHVFKFELEQFTNQCYMS